MPTTDQIADYLIQLPDAEYSDLLAQVDERRRERDELSNPRPSEPTRRDAVAQWLAKRHLATDPGIVEVYYLQSASAPENEIWFVEVNRSTVPADESLAPVGFGLDVEGVPYRLFVVDVTADQLEKLRLGQLHLPRIVSFHPYQLFRR